MKCNKTCLNSWFHFIFALLSWILKAHHWTSLTHQRFILWLNVLHNGTEQQGNRNNLLLNIGNPFRVDGNLTWKKFFNKRWNQHWSFKKLRCISHLRNVSTVTPHIFFDTYGIYMKIILISPYIKNNLLF